MFLWVFRNLRWINMGPIFHHKKIHIPNPKLAISCNAFGNGLRVKPIVEHVTSTNVISGSEFFKSELSQISAQTSNSKCWQFKYTWETGSNKYRSNPTSILYITKCLTLTRSYTRNTFWYSLPFLSNCFQDHCIETNSSQRYLRFTPKLQSW